MSSVKLAYDKTVHCIVVLQHDWQVRRVCDKSGCWGIALVRLAEWLVVVVFSSVVRIWGDCSTIHSPPAFCLLCFGSGDKLAHTNSTLHAERTPNKRQHTKLTLEKKILPPPLPGFELATFWSRVRRSHEQVIPPPPQWLIRSVKTSITELRHGRSGDQKHGWGCQK